MVQANLHPPFDRETIQTARVRSDDSSIPDVLRSPCGRDTRNNKNVTLFWDQGIVSHLADEHANVTHIVKRTITLSTPLESRTSNPKELPTGDLCVRGG